MSKGTYKGYRSSLIHSDDKYLDKKYYSKAVSRDNLWSMDYYLNRVFHNPSHSRNLVKYVGKDVDEIANSLDREIFFQGEILELFDNIHLNLILEDLIYSIENIKSDYLRDLVKKGFVWFLLSTKLYLDIDQKYINDEYINLINEFQSIIPSNAVKIEYRFLIQYLGSRSKADTARSFIIDKIKEILREE